MSNSRHLNAPTTSEYIIEFNKRYFRLTSHTLGLLDKILACRLLFGASLSTQETEMVLTATSEFKLNLMQSTLCRVFSSSRPKSASAGKPDQNLQKKITSFCRRRRRFSIHGRTTFESWHHLTRSHSMAKLRGRDTNPLDKHGSVSTCAVCGSCNHWARFCLDPDDRPPHKAQKRTVNLEDDKAFLRQLVLPTVL